MDRKTYMEDLKRKQEQHLENIQNNNDINWQPCLHDYCLDFEEYYEIWYWLQYGKYAKIDLASMSVSATEHSPFLLFNREANETLL